MMVERKKLLRKSFSGEILDVRRWEGGAVVCAIGRDVVLRGLLLRLGL